MLIAGSFAVLLAAGGSLGVDTFSPLELGVVELRRLGVTAREGIVVTHVYAMSPADAAGLRAGDVLLRLDGVLLNTREDLSSVLARHNAQDQLPLEYVRDGRTQSISIALGSPAEMFVKGCDARDADACFAAGNRYREGSIVARDSAKAVMYFEKGCWMDQWAACINLGRMLQRGEGIPRDAAKAVGLFQRACDAGVPEGCHNLGLQYVKGDGVSANPERGRELIRSACEMGDDDACPGVAMRQPTPPPAPASGGTTPCKGSYSLGGGTFSFSKDVLSAQACGAAAAEHAQTICRIKGLGAESIARGQWSFRQGTPGAINGFTTACR